MIVAPSTSLVASVRSTFFSPGIQHVRAQGTSSTPALSQHNQTISTRDCVQRSHHKGRCIALTGSDRSRQPSGGGPGRAPPRAVGAVCHARGVTTLTSTHGRHRSMADVVDRLAAVPGREGRLTHLERLPARPGRSASWPAWAASVGRRRVPVPRHRPAVAAPGRRSRRGVRRAARRAGHRDRVRQVAGLPAARADRGDRRSRCARSARRHHALPGADQGAGPGPAGRPRRARSRRPGHHPRRRQRPRPARVGARPRRVRPDQPGHAAPLAAARTRTVAGLPLPALPRRGRRVPPLPRGLRCARRPGAAPAPPDLRRLRRAPHVRARLGHGRGARGGGGAGSPASTSWRSPATPRRGERSRSRCGSPRSPPSPERTARRCGGPRRRRRPTCWPTWSPRASAPSPSSAPGAAPSRSR